MGAKLRFLGVITFTLFFIDIVLCLCISLVIPKYISHPEYYVYNSNDKKALREQCQCELEVSKFSLRDIEHDICGQRARESPRFIPSHNYDYGRKEKPLIFDPVVAISVLSFLQNTFKFVCTGVAISERWILTGEKCIEGVNDFRQINVRIRSAKRNRGGLIYDVQKFRKSNFGVVALKTKVPLSIKPMKIMGNYKNYYQDPLLTIGWDITNNKETIYRTHYITTDKCSKTKAFLAKDYCKDIPSGTPIIYDNMLFGMNTCTSKSVKTFTDFDEIDMQNWFQTILGQPHVKKYKSYVMRGFMYCENFVDSYTSKFDDFSIIELTPPPTQEHYDKMIVKLTTSTQELNYFTELVPKAKFPKTIHITRNFRSTLKPFYARNKRRNYTEFKSNHDEYTTENENVAFSE